MGTSLAGICINHGFEKDGFDLGRDLEFYWKFQKKINWETAFEKHKKSRIFDVCFLENATLILTDLETGFWGRTSVKYEVFSFLIQESTMYFSFKWSKESALEQRSFLVEDNLYLEDHSIGEKLPIELEFQDYTELIKAQIKETTGLTLEDFEGKDFYRFKYVGAEELLKDFDYVIRSRYLLRFMDSHLIAKLNFEHQIKLFEIFQAHAVENEIEMYHYIVGGDAEGKMPEESVFQWNYDYLIKEILLPNPEAKPLLDKYFTQKQLDWLFSIDPKDTEFYLEVLNDHLPKQKVQTPDQPHPNKRDHSPKKWWEFWK